MKMPIIAAIFLASIAAQADTTQEVLKISSDVQLSPLIAKAHVTTEFPLKLILDSSGKIKSVVLGDKNSKINYTDSFKKSDGVFDFPEINVSMDALQKPINISEKFIGINIPIAAVDATKLNQNSGGELTIKYPTSIFTPWSLQAIELKIQKDPKTGRWLAFKKGSEDKPIDKVKVGSTFLKLGIGGAQYENGIDTSPIEKLNQASCHGLGPVCVTSFYQGAVIEAKVYKQPETILSTYAPVQIESTAK